MTDTPSSPPNAPRWPVAVPTLLALAGFAGNSLLCRAALRDTAMDAASFTGWRLALGALVLWLLLRARRDAGPRRPTGDWAGALALFAYAAAFSVAYRGLSAATGALLLFGSVQVSMVAAAVARGERPTPRTAAGLLAALGGLAVLLWPGLAAPPLPASAAMVAAGVAWAAYTLRGRRGGDPLAATAGNFARALGPAAAWLAAQAAFAGGVPPQPLPGVALAVASGALASGLGYALWYAALPWLRVASAAVVQLSVPVVTALGGLAWLGEPLTLRAALAAAAVLGGIALVVSAPPAPR